MWKRISVLVKIIDRAFSTVILIFVLLLIILTVYLVQINRVIISDASNEQYQIYKPTEDDPLSLEKLQEQNREVVGWLYVDNTDIDYPLVQADNNVKYVNTSAFGEFSLTGALFLDYRNNNDFKDVLSVIYGHNMVDNVMFGGIVLNENEEYFNSHLHGTLYDGGQYHDLRFFAFLRADSYDTKIFWPELTVDDYSEWKTRVIEKSVHLSGDFPDNGKILMLSTCSSGNTNGRNILLAEILPDGKPFSKQNVTPAKKTTPFVSIYFEKGSPALLMPISIALVVITGLYFLFIIRKRLKSKRREEKDNADEKT